MSVEATLATWKLPKSKLSATEKLFLLSCADRAGEGGICWPSIKRLCADTCLDRKTVIAVRQSVMDKGLLVYTGETKGRTNSIHVMQLTYVKERHMDDELSSPENGTASRLSSTENGTAKQSRKRDTEPKRSLNLKEDLKTLGDFEKSPDIAKEYKDNSLFMDFYKSYPNKQKPTVAYKAFSKLKPTVEFVKMLNEDVAKRIQNNWEGRPKNKIPYPATYLNNREWEGEIYTPEKTKHGFNDRQNISNQDMNYTLGERSEFGF